MGQTSIFDFECYGLCRLKGWVVFGHETLSELLITSVIGTLLLYCKEVYDLLWTMTRSSSSFESSINIGFCYFGWGIYSSSSKKSDR